MRSSRIYKKAREYLGLSREQVCNILKIDMEDLIAIEDYGLQPSLDMEGVLRRLYGLDDEDYERFIIKYKGLSEKDNRAVNGLIAWARSLKRKFDKD